ncbi:23958_t:CDS:2, partial [Cetraspora pellucida]
SDMLDSQDVELEISNCQDINMKLEKYAIAKGYEIQIGSSERVDIEIQQDAHKKLTFGIKPAKIV